MAKNIMTRQLAGVIADVLQEYGEEIAEKTKQSVHEAADFCVREIKNTAPMDTGTYRKGWSAAVTFEDSRDIRMTVRNKSRYRLTHLLEFGHAKKNGGRVDGKPHIAPASEKSEKFLMGGLKNRIRNKGG